MLTVANAPPGVSACARQHFIRSRSTRARFECIHTSCLSCVNDISGYPPETGRASVFSAACRMINLVIPIVGKTQYARRMCLATDLLRWDDPLVSQGVIVGASEPGVGGGSHTFPDESRDGKLGKFICLNVSSTGNRCCQSSARSAANPGAESAYLQSNGLCSNSANLCLQVCSRQAESRGALRWTSRKLFPAGCRSGGRAQQPSIRQPVVCRLQRLGGGCSGRMERAAEGPCGRWGKSLASTAKRRLSGRGSVRTTAVAHSAGRQRTTEVALPRFAGRERQREKTSYVRAPPI